MKLLLGMLIGSLAQVLTFFQLQGRFKFEWMKTHQWAVVLLGIPISILFMTSVSLMVQHFDGQLWPSRLIGFVIGTIMFTELKKQLRYLRKVLVGLESLVIDLEVSMDQEEY